MKARVTEDCIACGRCIGICPEVFEMGEDAAQIRANEVPEEFQDTTREAADEYRIRAGGQKLVLFATREMGNPSQCSLGIYGHRAIPRTGTSLDCQLRPPLTPTETQA